MWAYSQEKVCLLLEIVNKSGQSLCPGRIYLSLVELSECSRLNGEIANLGQKQKQGWKRRMGFELNTCHSTAKGLYFSSKSVWTLFCLCISSHAGWGWGRQSGWDSSAAAYRNGVSREQSCQSPSIKSVSVLSTLPVNYLIRFKKKKAFFSEASLSGSPKTRFEQSISLKNTSVSGNMQVQMAQERGNSVVLVLERRACLQFTRLSGCTVSGY